MEEEEEEEEAEEEEAEAEAAEAELELAVVCCEWAEGAGGGVEPEAEVAGCWG